LDAARKSADGSEDYTAKVVVCDINQSMLDQGVVRGKKLGYHLESEIEWVCGNAENLPFEDNSFDAYTIAFGIRNVTNKDKVLEEAYRVLKPGGRLLVMEFSHVTNPFIRK
jgi:2-methoxy-6-polyprenyl-1,4-benzoquinol methylase